MRVLGRAYRGSVQGTRLALYVGDLLLGLKNSNVRRIVFWVATLPADFGVQCCCSGFKQVFQGYLPKSLRV